MDEKTIRTLEYPRIREILSGYAAFSASAELAMALQPTSDIDIALAAQTRTTEARNLLALISDFSVGGARDVRDLVEKARRSGVLLPNELLDIRGTLASGRQIYRTFERRGDVFPNLTLLTSRLDPPAGLIDSITQAISDQAEVRDNASDRLLSIRKETRIAHDRLLARLQRYISDPKTSILLQESIITQRDGRYVIPLQADYKNRIQGIVHDQSSSGATLFIEPLAVVELNNRWHELQLAERDEIQRILAALSGQVGREAPQIIQMVGALAELDLALMCAKYAEDLHAVEPVLLPYRAATSDHPGSTIRLYKARHPLLNPRSTVPIDILLDEHTFSLVITGPNTGGKTVTLKTLGLLALMAQSGLHIPAQSGSEISIFADIYADIGDEQSIEQSLSTFSAHITNIIRILKQATHKTLVLLDELGAGTDPQDGAALAQGILSYLMELRIPNLVATHYPELKSFAHLTPGTMNASMEFDIKSLRPTYRLIIGLPGKSNALLIAEKLGLPAEIVTKARDTFHPQQQRSEDLLEEILRQRAIARKERDDAEKTRRAMEKQKHELQIRLDKIEEERISILEQARSEADTEVESLKNELEEIYRSVKSQRETAQEVKQLQTQVEDIQGDLQARQKKQRSSDIASAVQHLQPGDRVRLRTLGMNGVITSVDQDEVEVQAGALRVRAKLSDIQMVNKAGKTVEDEKQPARLTHEGSISLVHPSPGMELDLRGLTTEDGLARLDNYLEDAYLANLHMVRIIHGKGTGRLRESIRRALERSKRVKSWEQGLDSEGGEGVTIARIALDD
ncbi:MAG: endonuclease MutS2 [Chloroflexi bacterium]|nr:endonuclease MutS2 [Chloroflexota bacterium]